MSCFGLTSAKLRTIQGRKAPRRPARHPKRFAATLSGAKCTIPHKRSQRHGAADSNCRKSRQPNRARGALIAIVVLAGIALMVSPASASPPNPVGSRGARAVAARTLSLHEIAHLRLVSHQGTQILNEQGEASGTLRGKLTIQIHIAYTEAGVTFTANPNGGTLSGHGVESYYVGGNIGHFSGAIAITHGTGRYAHASASTLHISGEIERKHYTVFVTVTGQMKY
jgi:hypothetical protein